MHDTLSMERWDGLALSQQLSQVCIEEPPVSETNEPAADDRVNLSDQENLHDYICSQDFFCTPDFITPIEQQFSVDFDNKETVGSIRLPGVLTPLRSKRPRPDTEPTRVASAWLEDNQPHQQLKVPQLSELPDEASSGFPLTGKKSQKQGSSVYDPPNSRALLTSLRRRVQSPVCIRNPFLGGELEKPDNSRKSRSQGLPVPIFGQNSMSRYRDEFHEIQEIGRGNFSRVFKVLNRIDGCLYAVKRSQHQLRQDSERKQALIEVQALASIGPCGLNIITQCLPTTHGQQLLKLPTACNGAHENVVRYHTAWFESDYLYIQMELCDGNLTQLRASNPVTALERTLLEIMRQILQALTLIHSKGLVHLDLKPDNMYVLNGVYKLGDFGRATHVDGSLGIEEGDGRYMPLEILNDDHSQLQKVDMFALGASMYELARGSPLPSSGPNFQALRQGKLTLLPGFSLSFQSLLRG